MQSPIEKNEQGGKNFLLNTLRSTQDDRSLCCHAEPVEALSQQMSQAKNIVDQMMSEDAFSQWLALKSWKFPKVSRKLK